ncbi:alpha-2-macroglobulin-like protein 1 [Gallus gallus]|uniref:alpha-2-macroglobulin-like protein 1 n=1 Tax=Gallus gallus TaxID=9031 RepID=UPI001AE5F424|nr:alpha-2-macroglobulin-like protein 1 [Gallus gallus]XP_046789464.1 alpha-2-macroglobulin-like protein 1 [Gallus gallus]
MRSPAAPTWLLLLILHLTIGASEALHYVVTSPAVFYHPYSATLWVHLINVHQPTQVTIQLQRADGAGNITLLERKVEEPQLLLNVTFPAPAPSKGKEEIAQLSVSIEGESLNTTRKSVMLRALKPGIFVQTDKAIYKPGQEVKFRIVSLDKDFIASDKKLPLVFLKDPRGNRIAQWRDVSPRQGIVDLSLPLAAEPALGTYTIHVEGKTHSFSVEEYVLPKFEVTIDLPPTVWEKDEKFQLEICGRYTYGKPVQGKVHASLCQPWSFRRYPLVLKESKDICTEIDGQTKKNGCFSTEVSMSSFNLSNYNLRKEFQVKASLVEEGTGLEMNNTKTCRILEKIFTVTFENTDDFYKRGLPYTGTMQLKRADHSALGGQQLVLLVNNKIRHSFLTDESGRVSFELDTSNWTETVELIGEVNMLAYSQNGSSLPAFNRAYLNLRSFFSKSQSFLHIHRLKGKLSCSQTEQLQVDYILNKEALGRELQSLDVVFLVLAKGTIANILRKELTLGAGLRGSFSLELPTSPELAPTATVLGYAVLPNGEMLAGSTNLNVLNCLPNKVKMAFSKERALPGSTLRMGLEASPGSLCAIRAVDRSVLLLKPEAELSMAEIYKVLPNFDYPGSIRDPPPCTWYRRHWYIPRITMSEPIDVRRSRRFILPPYWDSFQLSPYTLFQNAALKLLTNAKTRDDCKVLYKPQRHFLMGAPGPARSHAREDTMDMVMVESGLEMPMLASVPGAPSNEEEPPAPRTHFPETWLWDLVPVGEEGSAEMVVTVPDAITEWKAEMFCTARVGLGLAPATTLTVFKPFFVDLALPYAVIRGEAFSLVATVFNYLRQCLRVRVTLADSAELEVSEVAGAIYSICVCADEAKTFRWDVKATNLGEVNITISTEAISSEELCGNEKPVVPAQGRVDTVIKPLLVQPGGILVEKAHSSLLCQEASEEVSLELPANVLEGSQRAHVTVMGDIMGNALQNVDRLLAMPYGCGEQNMVRFAPNIYIQQYLEKSGQMNPDIRAKAQGFLQSGYQRELLYKHSDGSYSAFGETDDSGNTWLTAFVLKSFGQARAFVAIEERHITDAQHWLQRQQQESGCFRSVGKLFNNALQGGVSDELSLSAYVTAALLELGLPPTDPTVSSALKCLEASSTDDLYTEALLAYVCGLAGREEQQQARLQSLLQRGTSTEGLLFWKRKDKALSTEFLWAEAAPAEVEMTAYVLLAYLTQPQVSRADLARASQIVRWLSKQQNPYGGFASTQDTVVALQALAKYATLTYGKSGDLAVTVTAPTGSKQDFMLEASNRLVLQRAALHELPGQYGVKTHGQGCALVQVTLRYNIPPPPSAGTFNLHVETEPKTCTSDASTHFRLLLRAQYTGKRAATNMVVIEAKMPSGYIPDKSSVVELKRQKLVKKVEVQSDQVTIYLDQLTKEEETFSFAATQDFPVKNLQPATVTLYDYYETGDRTDAAYSAPCSSEDDRQTKENF